MKAFELVRETGRPALEADLLYLIARMNRATDGTMIVPPNTWRRSSPSAERGPAPRRAGPGHHPVTWAAGRLFGYFVFAAPSFVLVCFGFFGVFAFLSIA
jgi:hypothetical protein